MEPGYSISRKSIVITVCAQPERWKNDETIVSQSIGSRDSFLAAVSLQ